jgi:hypothetical protein
MKQKPIIALTGGPCGGKTTFMQELRAEDPHADRWLMVPEVAPLLFQAGLRAKEKCFQRSVVYLQIALEDSCVRVAKPGQVILCHRRALDPLAYWLRSGWEEVQFFECVGKSREELLSRYKEVVHLQAVAVGAEEHYRRWPDAHRPEAVVEAAEMDRLCTVAWTGHKARVEVCNSGRDWIQKSCVLRACLSHFEVAD